MFGVDDVIGFGAAGTTLLPVGELMQSRCKVCSLRTRRIGRVAEDLVPVVRCVGCGLVTTDRYPAPLSMSSSPISTETTEDFTESLLNPVSAVRRRQDILATNRSSRYEDFLGRSGSIRILEIGCGSGGLGRQYSQLGNDYTGVDIDPRPVAIGLTYGLNLVSCDFMQFECSDPFDVIAMSQVLEHVLDPIAFLSKVRTHLAPGGVVHIDVPNHHSLAGWPSRLTRGKGNRLGGIEFPHHCMSYTTTSLRQLLATVSSWSVRVFSATPLNTTWGQAIHPSLAYRAYYGLSWATKSKSLLVGICQTDR